MKSTHSTLGQQHLNTPQSEVHMFELNILNSETRGTCEIPASHTQSLTFSTSDSITGQSSWIILNWGQHYSVSVLLDFRLLRLLIHWAEWPFWINQLWPWTLSPVRLVLKVTLFLLMYVGVVELLRNLPLYGGGFVLTVNTRFRGVIS